METSEEEESSSVRSRAARIREREGPGSPIVVGRERRSVEVGRSLLCVNINASVAWLLSLVTLKGNLLAVVLGFSSITRACPDALLAILVAIFPIKKTMLLSKSGQIFLD